MPLADSAGTAGYCILQTLRVLFKLAFVFEDLAQEVEQEFFVRIARIRNAVENTIAILKPYADGAKG